MELPTVVHPTVFNVKEVRIQVVTFMPLTDKQAAVLAMHAWRSRRWRKKDQGSTYRYLWHGDQAALASLAGPQLPGD